MYKFRFFCLFILINCSFLFSIHAAEEPQTYMKVSFDSWNSFMDEMRFIGETASNPAFAATIEGPIRLYFGRKFMKAVDFEAPIGLALQHFTKDAEPGKIFPIICFPMKNATPLIDFFTEKDEDLEITEREDGVIEWEGALLKEINGCTWFVTDERQLSQLETLNPNEFLGTKAPGSLHFEMDLQKFPGLQKILIESLEEGSETALKKEEEETDEAFELRQKTVRENMQYVKEIYASLNNIVMDFSVNKETHSILWNTKLALFPDSKLAETVKQLRNEKPLFTGFAKASGLFRGFGISGSISRSIEIQTAESKQVLNTINDFLAKNDYLGMDEGFWNELLEQFKPILNEIQTQKFTSSGFLLDAQDGGLNLVGASGTEHQKELAGIFDQMVEFLKKKLGENFDPAWVQTDVSACGMNFRQISIPTEKFMALTAKQLKEEAPKAEEIAKIKELFGEKLTFAIGGKDSRFYWGIGNDPITKLSECLEETPTENLSELKFDLRRTFQYIEALCRFGLKNMEESEENAESRSDLKKIASMMGILAEILGDSEKTNLIMTQKCSETEILIQVEGEEGVTKIIGTLPSLLVGGML